MAVRFGLSAGSYSTSDCVGFGDLDRCPCYGLGAGRLLETGLPGCPYRFSESGGLPFTDGNPAYGLQLHHPWFLELVGAPESARLLDCSPTFWVDQLGKEQAMAAAINLQRDAGVMLSNLQILSQFAMAMNRMSFSLMALGLGQLFPRAEVNDLSPVRRAARVASYMSAMGLCTHSHISETTSTPSVDVSTWNNSDTQHSSSDIRLKLDNPIDLTGHILSPFFVREFVYQGSHFHSIAHLMCYHYAVLQGQKTFANGIRKWVKHLTDFPTPRFQTPDWQVQRRSVLTEIYGHLCLTDLAVRTSLINSGPRPFTLHCLAPWGALHDDSSTTLRGNLISDIFVETRVHLVFTFFFLATA